DVRSKMQSLPKVLRARVDYARRPQGARPAGGPPVVQGARGPRSAWAPAEEQGALQALQDAFVKASTPSVASAGAETRYRVRPRGTLLEAGRGRRGRGRGRCRPCRVSRRAWVKPPSQRLLKLSKPRPDKWSDKESWREHELAAFAPWPPPDWPPPARNAAASGGGSEPQPDARRQNSKSRPP
ncbi:unnamed protein product, partial [Prorocentrum cordatum]